jgi:hypothetical protein
MAVARKHRIAEDLPSEAPVRARPRRVKDSDAFPEGANPIGDQLIRLEDAFSSDAADSKRYPGKVRLAILLGAPVAAWALIAWAALGLKALL